MKDGVFISDYSSEHFYKIQNVTKDDSGKYQCYARNDVGVIVSENISLVVARKLSKPHPFNISDYTLLIVAFHCSYRRQIFHTLGYEIFLVMQSW